MNGRQITLHLDAAQADALTDLSERRDRSISYLVRQAVADYLATQGILVSVSRGRNTQRALREKAERAAS